VTIADVPTGGTTADDPVIEIPITKPEEDMADPAAAPNFERWPAPYALIERLKRLARHDGGREWAADVCTLIDRLGEVRVDDPAATELLSELRSKAGEVAALQLGPHWQRDFERAQLDLIRDWPATLATKPLPNGGARPRSCLRE
jgi:hypothetical protein